MRSHSLSPLIAIDIPAHLPASGFSGFIATLTIGAFVAGAIAASPFVGTLDQAFERRGERPMRMPSDVAVVASGRVYVADGMHDRVLVFESDGAFAGEIGAGEDQNLKHPSGLGADTADRVWIADVGNHRLVCVDGDGATVEIVVPPLAGDGAPPELTDVALSRDGRWLWCVDNHAHRLLRLERANGVWASFGRSGSALGQLQYPYMLAVAASGDVFLSDVINARIAGFDAEGRPFRSIGAYGVTLGSLYRPKGVAVDADGRVWVSDSVTGVIQVFRGNGAFLDVLRDASDGPMRFAQPNGLAFDADGALYVAELGADRIRKVTLAVSVEGWIPKPPNTPPSGFGQQAQNCTICHTEWLPEFANAAPNLLMPAPDSPPNDPFVARAESCLSCHDGSVVDSRRRVWEDHGHATGVDPPQSMRVPSNLPLVDGKIACRTCHSAHASGQATGDIKTAVFLRVPNAASEMCMSCHTDKTRGAAFGTHPTGGMPWPVPQALIEAGAKVGPDPRELTCQVCHTPHGAQYDHLLVLGVNSNELCMQCHDQMRPGMFRPGAHLEHPLMAKVNDEQRAAVQAMGTRLGPDDELVCLSCHKLHHGKGDRYMLADDLNEGQMCLRCHSQRATLLGSTHDLRISRPDERNRLGMTASSGGPCSSCHMFHRYARVPKPTLEDSRGLCMTCHSDGACAESAGIGTVNHSSDSCTVCHDPHSPMHAPFLTAPAQQLCVNCHREMGAMAGGAHDAHGSPWRSVAQAPADACLGCHRPHGDTATGLFRLPAQPALAPQPAGKLYGSIADQDAVCIACHSEAAFGSGAMAAAHPVAAGTNRPLPDELPLVHTSTGGSRIGCKTCHDPHAHANRRDLLRGDPIATKDAHGLAQTDLCVKCHSDMAQIQLTSHSPDRMAAAGLRHEACLPCHQPHGPSEAINAALLWPKTLDGVVRPHTPGSPMRHTDDTHCTACHVAGGAAAGPAVATHPDVPIVALTGPGLADLPVFDAQGRPSQFGAIGCRTCHLPHGRPADLEVALLASERERAQMRLQLRPFVAPNVCTSCHGDDGLRRYLYFHDAERRGPAPTSTN